MPQEPTHLSSNHRDALEKILRHPLSHNVDWHATLLLLESVAAVTERHDGKFEVELGGRQIILTRPRDKDLDPQQVVDVRKLLLDAGYTLEDDAKG